MSDASFMFFFSQVEVDEDPTEAKKDEQSDQTEVEITSFVYLSSLLNIDWNNL